MIKDLLYFLGFTERKIDLKRKTIHFKKPYPSLYNEEFCIRPILNITLFTTGSRFTKSYNIKISVVYQDEVVITESVGTWKDCVEAEKQYNELDDPDLYEDKLTTKFIDEIKETVDKYTIDMYAERYAKMHERVFSKHEMVKMISPIGSLNLDSMTFLNNDDVNMSQELIDEALKAITHTPDKEDSDIPKTPEEIKKRLMDSFGGEGLFVEPKGNGWYTNVKTGETYHGKKNIPEDYLIIEDKSN